MSRPQAVNPSQLERDSDAASSAASYPPYLPANMAQQNNQTPRQQPASYPSPRSYPSPQMSASYTYPPPQNQQNAESYHASPTGSSMSLPSHNTLPPLRQVEGQHPVQQPMGSPMPPSVAPMSAYYQHPSPSVPPGSHISPAQAAAMRYPMSHQVQDPRMMSGGRSKKEIKRRTKTGCLTCRKRRIKCDETHPACRNCQKSKRECMGYDPIFKQQPGPPPIQPAPSTAPVSHSNRALSGPPPNPYSSIPHGYAPASSAAFGTGIGGSTGSPASSLDPNFDFAAIDPALGGADTSIMSVPHMSFDGNQQYRTDIKAGMGTASPFSSAASLGQDIKGAELPMLSFGKRIKITDLFSSGGVVPPPLPPNDRQEPIAQDIMDEIKVLYSRDYGVYIDRFLETHWYLHDGLEVLLANNPLLQYFAGFVQKLRDTASENYEGMLHLQSFETALVWYLMALCRSATLPATINGANGHGAASEDPELTTARNRLDIFESLITNQTLSSNPLSQPSSHAQAVSAQIPGREREFEFWRLLGHFVSIRINDATSNKAIDDTLIYIRSVLDMLENRDILYSMAIARHIGSRMPEFPDHLQQAYNNDDSDDRTKLFVAKRFVEEEATGKGTSQVAQRLCGMAIKSWSMMR